MPRRVAPLLLLLAALSLLAGCSKSKAPVDGVTLLIGVPDGQLETWQKAVDAFSEAGQTKVSLQNIAPDKYLAKLEARLASGTPPDLVAVPSTAFPQLVMAGRLTDLKPLLQTPGGVRPSDFFPATIRAFQYQSSTYGLPYDVSVAALAYNQDLFELQGIPEPTTDWTWQEYLQNAKQLTRDSDDDGVIDTWGTTAPPWWQVMVWQSGGELVDDVTNPQRSTLSTPEAQQGLQALADLSGKWKVAPGPGAASGAGRVALLGQGKAAMAFITREDVPVLNRVADLRWGGMALPKGKVAANFGLTSGLSIPKNAAHPQDAWKLLAYLTSPDGQQQLLNGSFLTPPLEALAGSESFSGVGTSGTNPFLTGLKIARPLPFTPRYQEVAAVWAEELAALWTGQRTVQQVTARIDERVNELLAQGQPVTAWLLPLSPRG